jgi:hypothetical protein
MKTSKFNIYLLLLILLLPNAIRAQEEIVAKKGKSSIGCSLVLAHYANSNQKFIGPVVGFYTYPVDPGIEISYHYLLNKRINLGAGLSYQKVRIPAYVNRFRFNEVSIPILFEYTKHPERRNKIILSTALSAGKVNNLIVDNLGSGDIWHTIPLKYVDNYSEKCFFMDILFSPGISLVTINQNEISISPFVKYRIIDNWMQNYREHFYYGIKLNYQLNFKTKQ